MTRHNHPLAYQYPPHMNQQNNQSASTSSSDKPQKMSVKKYSLWETNDSNVHTGLSGSVQLDPASAILRVAKDSRISEFPIDPTQLTGWNITVTTPDGDHHHGVVANSLDQNNIYSIIWEYF